MVRSSVMTDKVNAQKGEGRIRLEQHERRG
jgi:hypothetical protein